MKEINIYYRFFLDLCKILYLCYENIKQIYFLTHFLQETHITRDNYKPCHI